MRESFIDIVFFLGIKDCLKTKLDLFKILQLVGIRKKRDTSFVLSNKNNEEEVMIQRREGIKSRRLASKEEEEEELREGNPQEMYRSGTPTTAHSNSRRRKGIPHRAPFGS